MNAEIPSLSAEDPSRSPDHDPAAEAHSGPAREWDLATRVRTTAGELLSRGYPAIEHTAKVLDVSVRTLQRRLAQVGLTYSGVVDDVRLSHARHLLGTTDTKLGEISAELGFKDAGSFSRAFKRWTGVEPRSYRKSL